MKSLPPRSGPGRPPADIDWEKVDQCLRAQCLGTEVARLLGICPDTLYDACEREKKMLFSEYSALKKTEGKEILRMKQYQVAMAGDKTMLVWLGKQLLEQRDRQEHSVSLQLADLFQKDPNGD
jgi:hypothetical protein